MKKNKKTTIYAIMTRNLTVMITTITLIIGLFIVMAVGFQLGKQQRTSSKHILYSLEETRIDNKDDWYDWQIESYVDLSSSFVSFNNNKNIYRSDSMNKFLKKGPRKVLFFKNLYFVPGFGFYDKITYHDSYHNHYEIWKSINGTVAVLIRVIEVTVLLLLLTLIFSPIYIRWLAKKLTNPIVNLADESALSDFKKVQDFRLTEPESPLEVTILAKNFNALLAELKAKEDQKQNFLMNATHELKTPIATIYSHAQLIERHGNTHPEMIAKSINYVKQEAQHMNILVSELLTLSRIERTEHHFTAVNLTNLVRKLIAKYQSTFSQDIVGNLAEQLSVVSDHEIIEKIIEILVSNAAKYSPAASKIMITVKRAAGQDIIQVADQGIGIPNVDKQHIFERFYRSDEIRGTISGTGLGLAIAHELAESIGAQISVTDNHPQGSIFTVILNKQKDTEI